MFNATAYTILKKYKEFPLESVSLIVVGTIISFIVAFELIRFVLAYNCEHSFEGMELLCDYFDDFSLDVIKIYELERLTKTLGTKNIF